jgi:hypothetical protein
MNTIMDTNFGDFKNYTFVIKENEIIPILYRIGLGLNKSIFTDFNETALSNPSKC